MLEHEPDDPSEFPRAKHVTRLCITDHPNIMRTVLVTGARGFIGKHLVEALRRNVGFRVIEFGRLSSPEDLSVGLRDADVIYHLDCSSVQGTLSEFKLVGSRAPQAGIWQYSELPRA